ncbi:SDR family NAD(P)-dependent oxidoreductase [Thalassomonas actiniarum]|uniref:SDR family NAD(P)-dependent oxidoreductase n=1 Tax=Thalassomonas actiniarum TaxID=485447 RepID=A0AAE9YUB4_9GAMM|nr:SDR family NAD(P)-dependent oxidoreductase [Thalassomonas actiniarum]WDE00559.1 SDR family NAD(P)-dependent oxidoreductase [Thalassomonas actiniarum]
MTSVKLLDKKILITAAASDLGRHLTQYYLAQGAEVISLDMAVESLQELKQAYSGLTCIPCDITQGKEINAAFAQIERQFGYVDVLINNASIKHNEPLFCFFRQGDRKHHLDAWQSVLDINLTAPFVISGYFVELLAAKSNPGVIVNISSASPSPGGKGGQSAYAASKAGLHALSKSWSRELRPLGIRVVSISPDDIHFVADDANNTATKATGLRKLAGKEAILDLVNLAINHELMNGKVIDLSEPGAT